MNRRKGGEGQGRERRTQQLVHVPHCPHIVLFLERPHQQTQVHEVVSAAVFLWEAEAGVLHGEVEFAGRRDVLVERELRGGDVEAV